MSAFHLVQLNVAKLKEPLDSPLLADFVGNLDRINDLAEQAPGFVWRFQDEAGNATAIRPFGEDVIVNMSMWTDIDALREYAFKSDHTEIMRRRREWFEPMNEAYSVLWWVPAGHIPTVREAARRLGHLRIFGPSPTAFTFKEAIPPPADDSV